MKHQPQNTSKKLLVSQEGFGFFVLAIFLNSKGNNNKWFG